VSLPTLFGKKLRMLQIFLEDGTAVPVTAVQVLPLTITQLRNKEKEGYSSVQVGMIPAKSKALTKAQMGHLSKSGAVLFRKLKEVRVNPEALSALQVGNVIEPLADGTFLTVGIKVKVTGQSIGKGFQGNTKRWNHHRGLMSHGSKSHRLPGSIGAGTTPGRVFKGLKMAGKMGNERVTVNGLEIVKVYADKNVILIKGSLPGVEGGFLTIHSRPSRWNQAKY
jgi:large subunit ribosomal protein L3